MHSPNLSCLTSKKSVWVLLCCCILYIVCFSSSICFSAFWLKRMFAFCFLPSLLFTFSNFLFCGAFPFVVHVLSFPLVPSHLKSISQGFKKTKSSWDISDIPSNKKIVTAAQLIYQHLENLPATPNALDNLRPSLKYPEYTTFSEPLFSYPFTIWTAFMTITFSPEARTLELQRVRLHWPCFQHSCSHKITRPANLSTRSECPPANSTYTCMGCKIHMPKS